MAKGCVFGSVVRSVVRYLAQAGKSSRQTPREPPPFPPALPAGYHRTWSRGTVLSPLLGHLNERVTAMKKLLAVMLSATAGFILAVLVMDPRPVASGGEQEKCAAQNGDVNADGKVDVSDAVTVLSFLFLGNPRALLPNCDPPELTARIQELEARLASAQVGLAICQGDLATCQGDLQTFTEATAVLTAQVNQLQAQLADCLAENCPGSGLGLPDTSQKVCYGDVEGVGWTEVPCGEAACQGQDAQYATGCPSEGRFADNGDGTVTDHCTGLMWQRDADPWRYTWCAALTYCENLSFAGHGDWRLPNISELQSIIDYARFNPAIDPVFGAFSTLYWSSTSFAVGPVHAWVIDFGRGGVSIDVKNGYGYSVRAVRNAP